MFAIVEHVFWRDQSSDGSAKVTVQPIWFSCNKNNNQTSSCETPWINKWGRSTNSRKGMFPKSWDIWPGEKTNPYGSARGHSKLVSIDTSTLKIRIMDSATIIGSRTCAWCACGFTHMRMMAQATSQPSRTCAWWVGPNMHMCMMGGGVGGGVGVEGGEDMSRFNCILMNLASF